MSKCLQQNEFFRGQQELLRLVSGLLVAEAALHWIRKHPSFQRELLDSTDGLARFEMLHCGPLGSALSRWSVLVGTPVSRVIPGHSTSVNRGWGHQSDEGPLPRKAPERRPPPDFAG